MPQLYLGTITIIFLMTASLMSFGQNRVIKTMVHFGVNRFDMDTQAIRSLTMMFDTLRDMEVTKVILKGNSDNAGADSLYNLLLSQKRADTVRSFLVTNGVAPKVISTSSFGEEKPIADNNTEEGRQRNRRVEILISYKPKAPVAEAKEFDIVVKSKKDTLISYPNGWYMYGSCVYNYRCLTINTGRTNIAVALPKDSIVPLPPSLSSSFDLGSFSIDLKPQCPWDSGNCLRSPIYVRIPIPDGLEKAKDLLKSAIVFESRSAGRSLPSESKIKTVRMNGKAYFDVPVYCLKTTFRCASRNPCDAAVRLYVPHKYKFASSVTAYSAGASVALTGNSEIKPDKPYIEDACLLCWDSAGVFKTTLTDAAGHNITLTLPLKRVIKMRALDHICKTPIKDTKKHPRQRYYIRKRYHIPDRLINRAMQQRVDS